MFLLEYAAKMISCRISSTNFEYLPLYNLMIILLREPCRFKYNPRGQKETDDYQTYAQSNWLG